MLSCLPNLNQTFTKQDDDDSSASGLDSDDGGAPKSRKGAAAGPRKPRRVGIGKRTAFIKQLKALTHDQLAEVVADFFGPTGAGKDDRASFEAALYAPPGDVAELSRQIERALEDEPLRARLRAAGPPRAAQFSWAAAADATAGVLQEAIRERHP